MTNHENSHVETTKVSLQSIVNDTNFSDSVFQIPIYQRLYTWGKPEVKRLLDDLWHAFQHDKEQEYFIGAIVVSPEESCKTLELVDGQQRFTTLWLLAAVAVARFNDDIKTDDIKTDDEQWIKLLGISSDKIKPRLDFVGRNEDKINLEAIMSSIKNNEGSKDVKRKLELSNPAMRDAVAVITDYFMHGDRTAEDNVMNEEQLKGFLSYIFQKATFVITTLRFNSTIEKNKFFDNMNSRGIQLEKHEILKVRLLMMINKEEQASYAKAWDICADINSVISPALQNKLGFSSKESMGHTLLENISVMLMADATKDSKKVLANIADDSFENERSLKAILFDGKVDKPNEQKVASTTSDYKSPVGFPVFLLHVLRVIMEKEVKPSGLFDRPTYDSSVSLDDKKLLEIFGLYFKFDSLPQDNENPEQEKAKKFIEYLLLCRLLMDNFVIKGQLNQGTDHANWRIWSALGSKDSAARSERKEGCWPSIIMLQNMMYFSRDLHRVPWLSGLLLNLRELWCSEKGIEPEILLECLRQQDKEYVVERFGNKPIAQILNGAEDKGLGTGTPHYWFYKLEYCLWEEWFNKPVSVKISKPAILMNAKVEYRFRHVTSIEHVSPQSKPTLDNLNDRFGNLALISVSSNSSYSNLEPNAKANAFNGKLERGMIESLKLAHIFGIYKEGNFGWNTADMERHEIEMFKVLKLYHVEVEIVEQEEKTHD